jgi:hypothetical protein
VGTFSFPRQLPLPEDVGRGIGVMRWRFLSSTPIPRLSVTVSRINRCIGTWAIANTSGCSKINSTNASYLGRGELFCLDRAISCRDMKHGCEVTAFCCFLEVAVRQRWIAEPLCISSAPGAHRTLRNRQDLARLCPRFSSTPVPYPPEHGIPTLPSTH